MASFTSSATTCGARKHAWTNRFLFILSNNISLATDTLVSGHEHCIIDERYEILHRDFLSHQGDFLESSEGGPLGVIGGNFRVLKGLWGPQLLGDFFGSLGGHFGILGVTFGVIDFFQFLSTFIPIQYLLTDLRYILICDLCRTII